MTARVTHIRSGDDWTTVVEIGDQTVRLPGWYASDRAVPAAMSMLNCEGV